MKPINKNTNIQDDVLEIIAYLPTASLPHLIDEGFLKKLQDKDFMRIAFFLAQKSYREDGCPIGAVIIDSKTSQILGKGHNTLVQENNPYNHGETSAIRDAGRRDFSSATIFTTLSPCDLCVALMAREQFDRVVVGDVTNASGGEDLLRERKIKVDVLEDPEAVALYGRYRQEKPDLDAEDWKGLARK